MIEEVSHSATAWEKEVMNRRKFKRSRTNFYEDSPYKQVKGFDPDFHALKTFGSLCTVHDHKDAHSVPGRKGVILGVSELHHEKVDKIIMLDTKRLIYSIDVTLSPRESQPVVTFDMAYEFYQRVQISDLHLPQEFDQEELTNE